MTISDSEFREMPEEQVTRGMYRSIVHTKNLMMAILNFTDGPWDQPQPFHSHPHEQIAYIAEGEIVFYCEDRPETHLKAGDIYAVPSGKQHTVKLLTEKVRIVDTFTPVREDFLKT
jgi:quercetin dioxygenase-like cupin family protein